MWIPLNCIPGHITLAMACGFQCSGPVLCMLHSCGPCALEKVLEGRNPFGPCSDILGSELQPRSQARLSSQAYTLWDLRPKSALRGEKFRWLLAVPGVQYLRCTMSSLSHFINQNLDLCTMGYCILGWSFMTKEFMLPF